MTFFISSHCLAMSLSCKRQGCWNCAYCIFAARSMHFTLSYEAVLLNVMVTVHDRVPSTGSSAVRPCSLRANFGAPSSAHFTVEIKSFGSFHFPDASLAPLQSKSTWIFLCQMTKHSHLQPIRMQLPKIPSDHDWMLKNLLSSSSWSGCCYRFFRSLFLLNGFTPFSCAGWRQSQYSLLFPIDWRLPRFDTSQSPLEVC
jgi:hypothetical protein